MPNYTPDELLAIEADRRRRTIAAFRLGSGATAGAAGPLRLYPLLLGACAAIAIALFLGIGTLAQSASRSGASHSPAPAVTPSAR